MTRHVLSLVAWVLGFVALGFPPAWSDGETTKVYPVLFEARKLARAKKYDAAVKVLNTGIAGAADTQLQLELALVLAKSKKKTEAVQTLDALIGRLTGGEAITRYDGEILLKAKAKLESLAPGRKKLHKINNKLFRRWMNLAQKRLKVK